MHHGARKNIACLRTVRSIIENMITGVTRGFKYKMRYVYAHFPINVGLEKNSDDLWEVEIRYVQPGSYFADGYERTTGGMDLRSRQPMNWEQGWKLKYMESNTDAYRNQELHRREDRSKSHYAPRCARGGVEERQRPAGTHRQQPGECITKRSRHPTSLSSQEQGYKKGMWGRSAYSLSIRVTYLLQFLDGLYVSERGNIEEE